jgi:DNA-binding XRE family transcriptional regulator
MRSKFDEVNVAEVKDFTKEQLKAIGKKIKQFRNEVGLTLIDVSFYTYINLDSIYRLENGKLENTTLLLLLKICAFFKRDIRELFC